jgi:hypothetical protein
MCMNLSHILLCFAVTVSLAGCAGDLTLPSDASPPGDDSPPSDALPASLQVVSGDGQEGTVGEHLPKPLVVRLTDRASRPVPSASVVFRFSSDVPGAKVEPASVTTNEDGRASVRVRLGQTEGLQTIEATLDEEVVSGLRARFDLTALAREHGRDRGGDDDDDDDEDDDDDD